MVRRFRIAAVRRDGDFSVARLVQAHDAELANGLGNLASRVLALDELRSRLRAPPLEAEVGWGGLTSGTPLARVGPLFARIGAKAPGSLRTLSRRP